MGKEVEHEEERVHFFSDEHVRSLSGFFVCMQDINDLINELHNSISRFEFSVGSYYSDYYKEEFNAMSDCLKKAGNLMVKARKQLLSIDKAGARDPYINGIRNGYNDNERIEKTFTELKDHLGLSIKMDYSDGVREFIFESDPKSGTYCAARRKHAAPWRLGKDHLHPELKKLIKDKLIEEIEKELGEDKTRMTLRELLKKNKEAS